MDTMLICGVLLFIMGFIPWWSAYDLNCERYGQVLMVISGILFFIVAVYYVLLSRGL